MGGSIAHSAAVGPRSTCAFKRGPVLALLAGVALSRADGAREGSSGPGNDMHAVHLNTSAPTSSGRALLHGGRAVAAAGTASEPAAENAESRAPESLKALEREAAELRERIAELKALEVRYERWLEFEKTVRCGTGVAAAAECALRGRVEAMRARVADLEPFERKYEEWRRAAGAASCAAHRVGPTGGFCLKKWRAANGFNSCLPPAFADELGSLYEGGSVLDLGCGAGHYGRHFQRHFPNVTWVGLDGAENIEEASQGHVRFADLSEGLPSDVRHRPWDWAMSLEVAEHIPAAGEATFVHNLLSLSPRRGIVLTWAKPGQGGHAHVNCQPQEYVECVMRKFGWVPHTEERERLRKSVKGQCYWLSWTTMVFRPESNATAAEPRENLLPLPTAATPAFIAAYNEAMSAECPRMTEALHCRNQKRMRPSPASVKPTAPTMRARMQQRKEQHNMRPRTQQRREQQQMRPRTADGLRSTREARTAGRAHTRSRLPHVDGRGLSEWGAEHEAPAAVSALAQRRLSWARHQRKRRVREQGRLESWLRAAPLPIQTAGFA